MVPAQAASRRRVVVAVRMFGSDEVLAVISILPPAWARPQSQTSAQRWAHQRRIAAPPSLLKHIRRPEALVGRRTLEVPRSSYTLRAVLCALVVGIDVDRELILEVHDASAALLLLVVNLRRSPVRPVLQAAQVLLAPVHHPKFIHRWQEPVGVSAATIGACHGRRAVGVRVGGVLTED